MIYPVVLNLVLVLDDLKGRTVHVRVVSCTSHAVFQIYQIL